MKAFITGGTGFIGKHLVRRLSQTMHTMRCLARKGAETQELVDLGAQIVYGDITDRDSLREGMRGCDWVFNLADEHSYWHPDHDIHRRVNVQGTENVMECALKAEVSKVVHVSSVEVYGRPRSSPIREQNLVGLFRFSRFSQTKYEGDLIAWQLHREQGLPLVVVYPCAVLGSGSTSFVGGMIRSLVERRMSFKVFSSSALTFVHVDDVVETILRAAEKQGNLGERYFAGNTRLTLGELFDLAGEVADVPSPLVSVPDSLVMPCAMLLTWMADRVGRPPLFGLSTDAARTFMEGFKVDGSKAERELNISYTPIRTALEEECAWYRMVYSRDWKGQERRTQTRNRVDLPCDVKGVSHGQEARAKAQVVDLSRQGMYVAADTLLDEGTEMDAEIATFQFGNTFWVRGKVLRRTSEGMAVRFIEKVPMDIDRLMR